MRAAVFLDRDGTLIEDRGHLSDPSEVVLFPDTIPALSSLHGQLELFIVTHQSGIGRGLITREQVDRVNGHLLSQLLAHGIRIREVYVCPHLREDRCECIKPNPYFLRRAEADYEIELSRSFVIGDHPPDVELAAAAGATGIYVLTGHGERHRADLQVEPIITAGIGEAIERVLISAGASVLGRGGLVAFPTETVYGLGADAEDRAAVKRIFSVKQRPASHPLIVHLAEARALESWAVDVPRAAYLLAERFWPGPLTMILKKSARVPDEVTGGQNTVGLRVPAHVLARALVAELGADCGVAAPSANKFGRVSPTEARHVLADLGDEVDFVLDGGPCAVGIESTIVDLSGETPAILRPGGVSREALEAALGRAIEVRSAGAGGAAAVRAPGMLASHYAPNAEVVLAAPAELAARVRELLERCSRVAVLASSAIALPESVIELEKPSSPDDLAHDLYRALRDADARGAEVVVVEAPEERGIGLAILDRLKKASGQGV